MSLAHAILGFLNMQAMTGYDLKVNAFDRSVKHFWHADQAQIYRTLDRLAEQGYVTSEIEYQQDRPNRKVYQVTDAGRAELRRWLLEDQELPAHREPFLIQLFFSGQLSRAEVLRLMTHQLNQHRALLDHYQHHILPWISDQSDDDPVRMTLDMGIHIEHAYITWFEAAIARLGLKD